MVGSSSNSCKINLISSGFTGTFNGGWTFNSSGATSNGTNGYFNTTWIPGSNVTVNNNHYGIYTLQNEINTVSFGCSESLSTRHFMFLNLSNASYPEMGDSFITWNNSGINKGNTLISADSGTLRAYNNGVSVGSISYGGNVPTTRAFYYGARNDTAGIINYGSSPISYATLGLSLTVTDLSNYSTIINTFQTALGRNTY